MEITRKIVLFPTENFFAIVGTLRLSQDPYLVSLPDIFNEKSSFTHWAREHVHRPGRVFLSEVEFYALHDPGVRICSDLTCSHIPVADIRAVIDFHPEKFQGCDEKRREQAERSIQNEAIHFVLHQQVFTGTVDAMEVYRKSEGFLSVSEVLAMPPDEGAGHSVAKFLERIQCPQPRFMAVNLGKVFHS